MKLDEIKKEAEADFEVFVRLVMPNRLLGAVHVELIDWLQRQDRSSHVLVLLPRAHQKSVIAALYVAWKVTRNPAITCLYISSTSNLAEKQLGLIKQILTSKIYRRYWPEMVNEDKGLREKWNESEIAVDHPKRKEEGVRDPTVYTAGLTTSITGLHFDLSVMDDLVTPENAFTEEGRKKVMQQYSHLASIENPEAENLTVGTIYHPSDLYYTLSQKTIEEYNEEGEMTGSTNLYEVFERKVEDRGDGTGEFIWPRQQRPSDGKWFGFNTAVLMKKKAQYLDQSQFYAQYYNDANDRSNSPISFDKFQYYEKKFLKQEKGYWYYKERKLNVYAAMDFAFSMTKKADFSCIVTVGVDSDNNYFVLDVDRFKTDKVREYYRHILENYLRWEFKKIRVEITSGQKVLVKEIRDIIRQEGYIIRLEDYSPSRHEGTKEERINLTLQPRYDNRQIFHYRGGNCQILEDELVLLYPPHDDVKDAFASAIQIATPPKESSNRGINLLQMNKGLYNSRFGGISV